MVQTKSCNTITPEEHLAVDAAGFVWLQGCFDGFSAVMLLHRYVILWEPARCSSSYTLPKETSTASVPGGKKAATVAIIQIKREHFPTVRKGNKDSRFSLQPGCDHYFGLSWMLLIRSHNMLHMKNNQETKVVCLFFKTNHKF